MKGTLTSGAGASRPKNAEATAAKRSSLEEQAEADLHVPANSAGAATSKQALAAELQHEPELAAVNEYSSLQQQPAAHRMLKKQAHGAS